MREFAVEVLAMQEAESRRIARDLHDGAGQALTAARLHLQAAASAVTRRTLRAHAGAASTVTTAAVPTPIVADSTSHTVRDSLLATARLLDAAMDEVRQSAAALGPTSLDELGLVEALRRHCDDIGAASQIPIEFRAPALEMEPARAPAAIERACYRIAQEALTNALKHSQAHRIEVEVLTANGTIGVDVRDDGLGFDAAKARRGLGLAGMRDRVTLLGGSFVLESAPGQGTRVRAIIPADREVEAS